MQIRNNEITVFRNESWTLSKIIQNKDGSPYIISSEIKNPYWLVTVTSSLYEQDNRYILNKWLNLKNIPRFKNTVPIKLSNYGLKFSDGTLPMMDDDNESDFVGDETSGYANIAIFYEKDENSVIKYKYWEYDNNNEGDFGGKWVDYKCPLVTHFTNTTTSEWIEQTYKYRILLVGGISVKEHLLSLCDKLEIDTLESVSELELYNLIYNIDKNLVNDVDLNKPLYFIDPVYIILEPTSLYVKSNLKEVIS